MSAHRAPTVRFRVEPSRKAALLTAAVWATAAVMNLAWWQLAASGDPGPALGGLSLLAVSVLLVVRGRRPVHGQISWDGQWRWFSPAYPAGTTLVWPQVVMDMQQLMLVRLCNADGARWTLWLDAAAQPRDWLDLRRALFAAPPSADREVAAEGR